MLQLSWGHWVGFHKTKSKSTCLWAQTEEERKESILTHSYTAYTTQKTENSISHLPQETEVLQMRVLIVATLLCTPALYTPACLTCPALSAFTQHSFLRTWFCDPHHWTATFTRLLSRAGMVWGLFCLHVGRGWFLFCFRKREKKHNRPRGIKIIHPFYIEIDWIKKLENILLEATQQ